MIKPWMSEKIDTTCPSSPREGASVPGLIDGHPPGISKGPCLAGSNESVFSGWFIVTSAPLYCRYTLSLVSHRTK